MGAHFLGLTLRLSPKKWAPILAHFLGDNLRVNLKSSLFAKKNGRHPSAGHLRQLHEAADGGRPAQSIASSPLIVLNGLGAQLWTPI